MKNIFLLFCLFVFGTVCYGQNHHFNYASNGHSRDITYGNVYQAKDWGVVVNDNTKAAANTTALRAIRTAVIQAGGGIIQLEVGTIYVNDTIAISDTSSIMVLGNDFSKAVRNNTVINQITTNKSVFVVDAAPSSITTNPGAVSFSGFSIVDSVPGTSGAAIRYLSGDFWNVSYMSFSNWDTAINILGSTGHSAEWSINECYFQTCHTVGIGIANTTSPDEGDWNITNCFFFPNYPQNSPYPLAAIYWTSSGGGKISGCKVNSSTAITGQFQYGFYFSAATGSTADIQISGNNSFENYLTTGIYANKNSILLQAISIIGNEFDGGASTSYAIDLEGITTSTVTGNVISGFGTAPSVEAIHIGGGSNAFVSGNGIKDYPTDCNITPSLSFVGYSLQTSSVLGKLGLGFGTTITGANVTDAYLYVAGTNGTSTANQNHGVDFEITGAGSGSSNYQFGMTVDLLAGATPSIFNAAINGNNYTAGTGTNIGPLGVTTANFGSAIGGRGTAASSANVGSLGWATGGLKNIGHIGDATSGQTNSASAISGGIIGYAQRANASAIEFGGYFGLNSTQPTFASAALVADNAAESVPIFLARANGTTVFSIGSTGTVNNTTLTASQAVFTDGSKNLISKAAESIVAGTDLTAQSGTVSSVATFTPSANGTFRIGAYVAITAISAGTVTVTVTWTDENSASRTLTFFPMGLSTAGLTGTGFTGFSPADIRAKSGSAITIVSTFSGVSVTYDIGGTISQLR